MTRRTSIVFVEGKLTQQFQHYRMTRLTFGVSALSLVTNMVLRQNPLEHLETHPQEVRVALDGFYVDDGLMGADSIHEAIQSRRELYDLFDQGGFKLQKWKSSKRVVLASIPENFKETKKNRELVTRMSTSKS